MQRTFARLRWSASRSFFHFPPDRESNLFDFVRISFRKRAGKPGGARYRVAGAGSAAAESEARTESETAAAQCDRTEERQGAAEAAVGRRFSTEQVARSAESRP